MSGIRRLIWLFCSVAACAGERPSVDRRAAARHLHAFLQHQHGDERRFLQDARYSAAFLDLDGDGRDEAVVYFQARHFCGTGGCGIDIYARRNESWRVVSGTAIGWPPIRALETRTEGWRDLSIVVAGGGVIPGYEALLPFDGRTYPLNPSVAPARPLRTPPPGRTLIAREPDWRALYP